MIYIYINVIQFNAFHNFYHVIEVYNNNFNTSLNLACSMPTGNINAYTIEEYINNHSILKNNIYIIYDKFKNLLSFKQLAIILCNHK